MTCPHCATLTTREMTKRTGKAGRSWYVDETYLKVNGTWCYLYRAIDRDGNLVDCRLSETRDMEGAKSFFTQAVQTIGHAPERVTTDGHDSYPRAIRETLGRDVVHRTNPYLNNRLEQDHRGIKQRYYPMRGFGVSRQHRASAGRSMNNASTSACVQACANVSRHSQSNDGSTVSGRRR